MAKDSLNIDKLLNTKDKAKQAETFLRVANAPVIDLIIRYDGRTDKIVISSIGGQVPLPVIYKLLDMARDTLHNEELKALADKKEETK